jgi:hypothetical protein
MGVWFGPSESVEKFTDGYVRDEPLVSTDLKALILVMDRNVEYMQAEIRKVLDGLHNIRGLRIGDAFTMTIDDTYLDRNEYKVVLEFERKREE